MSITPSRRIEDREGLALVHPSVDAAEQASAEARPGDRVGRYELRERLGAGGMGIVHAAWDPELDRRVAIKLIQRGQAVSPDLLRRRLRREAQAMARLRHPNVVAVYDVGEADGQFFVAMEYVDGISLRKWLQIESRSIAEILAVFRGAGEGLAAAHAEGVIHRDFKPDNVLVARDGKALVLDFGLASWATTPGSEPGSEPGGDSSDELPSAPSYGSLSPPRATHHSSGSPIGSSESSGEDQTALTRPGVVLGTLNYMAPEQRRGRTIDARIDQYSFCVALWQALSGELPYGRGGSSRSLARARLGRLGKLRKGVPVRVERALRRGLAWSPDERWPDMRTLLDALAPPKRRRSWWLAIPVVIAGALWAAAGAREVPPERGCERQSERVRAVWNPSVAQQLGEVIGSRGELARRSWPYMQVDLDRWAASWTAVNLELCERYGLGVSRLHERQLLCLDRQLQRFELATDLLATASAGELEHGFDLLARLPDPAACRDIGGDDPHLGVDPQRFVELERAIELAELELALGRIESAETESAELLTATAAAGFEVLHVQVAELRGVLLIKLDRREEAIDVGFSGLAAAERNGGAELRLRAFANLAEIHINGQDLQGAERWLKQAKAIAAEQQVDRRVLRALASTEAWIAAVGGRLDEGITIFERALALCDPAGEPLEHAQITIARAQLLGWIGKAEQALEQFELGERELVELIGADHPTVLELRSTKALIRMQAKQWEPARTEMLAVAGSLEALRGGPTSLTVNTRAQAAWILDTLGDCEGARAEYDPLLPLARELLPYPSPDLGKVLTYRVQICGYQTPEAIELAREALALFRAAVGEQHVIVADTRRLLARAQFEAGELEGASEEVEAALAIFAAIDPSGAEFVAETRALAMLIRHAQGKPGALDGIEEVLAELDGHALGERLAALR